MSKYTTEIRFICEEAAGLIESNGFNNISEILSDSVLDKIFNFDFPIFEEGYRHPLERKILKHYYTREIGFETVGRFKLALDSTLNEIMPYYNQLYKSALIEFDPLTDVDYTKTHSETGSKTENETSNNAGTNNTTTNTNVSENAENDSISNNSNTTNGSMEFRREEDKLYSDTPQGTIDKLKDGTYLTNATLGNNTENTFSKTGGQETSTNKNKSSSASVGASEVKNTENKTGNIDKTANTTTDYTDKIIGKISGTSMSKYIKEFRETMLNIDMMVIEELEPLFMQIWWGGHAIYSDYNENNN